MADKDAEFRKRLLATFKIEAEEHLKGISAGLLELEKAAGQDRQGEIVEAVFREAHSLKGAARAVNLTEVESFCQAFESIFSALKRQELKPAAELFDLLQQALDHLGRALSRGGEPGAAEKTRQRELIRRLVGTLGGPEEEEEGEGQGSGLQAEPAPAAAEPLATSSEPPALSPGSRPPPPEPPPHSAEPRPLNPETVRVSTAKLSAVLLQSEEMLSVKLSAGQRAAQIREAAAAFQAWKKEWVRVLPAVQKAKSDTERSAGSGRETAAALTRIFEFLEWNSAFMQAQAGKYAKEAKAAERDGWAVGGMVNNLLEEMKKVLMFPFSSLLEIFPKIVRDLSRDGGKEVELLLRGGEIEIDRRILEQMKDPLVHLVRNAVDHGIEKPEEREAKGKPRCGTITITVAPRDGKIEIVVADDGTGIGIARLRAAVQKPGILAREKPEELTDAELLPLIFQSGVSTSPIITEISGRGLGLAIVKEKVEKLGGSVCFATQPDAGTTFRILLPLTVATFRGILVRTGEQLFVLPTTHVERAVRVLPEGIKTVENRETIQIGGRAVSLARLGAVLELRDSGQAREPDGQQPAVVVTAADQSIAFAVDAVLSEQEVLLKNLGPQLARVRNVAGATVLGNGRVVPILNVPDLMKSAVKAGASRAEPVPARRAAEAARQAVLVVEDSITSRALLKNILESAGYEVATAVDGIDGFTQLKTRAFDIVVSDVDMPRMNGFDLTARIRADQKLAELPVVLVTALASREDRERGIDVGANAYIVKSSFDQSNLLEVVERFI